MFRLAIIGVFLFVQSSLQGSPTLSGSVELNEISFNKLLKKFDATLIKFDVAFPYGDKHDAYVAVARDAKDVDELLVAEVGVKDYGEKDNEALAMKYGANKENFPVVKLFLKGKEEPIAFDESKGFTADELRRFVRENTGLYLSLPGCVRELDLLALKFVKSDENKKKLILTEVKEILSKPENKDKTSGKIYKMIMEKTLEKGGDFPNTELERIKKLLSGKISEDKKKELNVRQNILQAFQTNILKSNAKEEL